MRQVLVYALGELAEAPQGQKAGKAASINADQADGALCPMTLTSQDSRAAGPLSGTEGY